MKLEVKTKQFSVSEYETEHMGIVVPSYSGDRCNYIYVHNFQTGLLKRYKIDLTDVNNIYFDYLEREFNFTVQSNFLNDLIPHACIMHKNKVYVFLLNSFYYIVIDTETDDVQVVEDPEKQLISSTNVIVDNCLYYARYSVQDRYDNYVNKIEMDAQIVKLNLNNMKYTVICNFKTCDICHSVSVSPDKNYYIAIAASAEAVLEFKSKKFENTPENLKKLQNKGIQKSQIHVYSRLQNKFFKIESYDTPGHTEFDLNDSQYCYLSAHNVCANPYDGSLYYMGQASIHKLELSNESRIVSTYTADDLFRMPCHKVFRKNNKIYILAISFPQQVQIIQADTMQIDQKVQLIQNAKKVNMADGAFRYPRTDRTPFSIFPCNDSDFIYTVDKFNISMFDINRGKFISKVPYNIDNRPFIMVGHSSVF